MNTSLNRVILYVQDVGPLAEFYRDVLGLPIVEEIEGEWSVHRAGACELALHRVGKPYRVADPASWQVDNNVKLVLTVDRELAALRAELVGKGVPMGAIKSYPGLTGPLCDGRDRRATCFSSPNAYPTRVEGHGRAP